MQKNTFLKLNSTQYLGADKRQWIVGKLYHSNGIDRIKGDFYAHTFEDCMKLLLEFELRHDFSASDIVRLRQDHKKAILGIMERIRSISSTKEFKDLLYIRNGGFE